MHSRLKNSEDELDFKNQKPRVKDQELEERLHQKASGEKCLIIILLVYISK